MAINYREILDTYQRLQDEANQANEQRYGQLLGTIREGRENTFGLLDNLGESEFGRIDQSRQRERGRAEQDLISRGLGNTTIRESVLRGVEDDAGRARNELTEDVSRQKAGVEQSFTAMLANAIEGRTDQGPNLGAMAQLVQQAASAPGDLNTGLSANARAGRSAFGTPSRYFNRGGGGGGGGSSSGFGFTPARSSGGGGSTSGFSSSRGGGSSTGGFSSSRGGSSGGGSGGASLYRAGATQAAQKQAAGGSSGGSSGGGFGRIGPAGSMADTVTQSELRLRDRQQQSGPDLGDFANPGNEAFSDLAGQADLDLGGEDDQQNRRRRADRQQSKKKDDGCPPGTKNWFNLGCF